MGWSITYRDGSANAYHFRGDGNAGSFEYVPVKPEHSSTGMYSGGDPRSDALGAKPVATLWQHVRALEADRRLHVGDRMKGTGAFDVQDEAGTRTFIIKRGPQLAAFDDFLASLG
jgi:hypothetical protein